MSTQGTQGPRDLPPEPRETAYERRERLDILWAEREPGWEPPPRYVTREELAAAVKAAVAAALREQLERVYPAQMAFDHEADWRRYSHADLGGMTAVQLADERARLRLRLMLDPMPDPWLVERLQAVEEAHGAER